MNQDKERIGLIGVGLLGTALAERLLQQGFEISGCDVDADRLDALTSAGGTACHDASQVFRTCNIVLLSLPTSGIGKALLEAERPFMREGQIVVDTTTGAPEAMVVVGGLLAQRGVDYVEATVAGSSVQAREGHAILFVGGADAVVARLRHVLSAIATTHFHLGPIGSATRFKLVHNLVLGLNRAVLAEGLSFAEALGFAPANVLEILRQTPAASAVMDTKGQKMVSGDWLPQARLSQHLKDVRLILDQSELTGAKTPLSEVHRILLERAEELGFGQADNSAVLEAFRTQPNRFS